jgi:hypothetical protein
MLVQFMYGHWVYFTAIWYILWSIGIFCGHLVYFSRVGMLYLRIIWQPCCQGQRQDIWWSFFRKNFSPPPPHNLMDTSLIKNGIIKCQFLGGADIKLFLGWKLRLRFLSLSLFFFTTHLVYYISLLELHFVAWTKKVT